MRKFMKYKNFLLLLFLMTLSCKQSISVEEKQTIESALINEIDKFFDYDQNTHVHKVKEMYWDSKDFICINDTKFYNYESLMNATREGVKPVLEFKLVNDSIKFQVINKYNALVVISGRLNVVLKDSASMEYEPYVCSILFRKIDDKWKITYFQQDSEISFNNSNN